MTLSDSAGPVHGPHLPAPGEVGTLAEQLRKIFGPPTDPPTSKPASDTELMAFLLALERRPDALSALKRLLEGAA